MSHNPILILGKNGQVGSALVSLLGNSAIAAGREDVDLESPNFIPDMERFIGDNTISAVINAAAYTQVDQAETKHDKAFRINATAPGKLAAWCNVRGIPLVHYSTDYVFDGSGDNARREDDLTKPLNVYGESKLAGERIIATQGDNYLIFRTSWVYDVQGKNFFNTIRRLITEKESLNVIADQIGAPTYARDLARVTLEILEKAINIKPFPSDIYHLCNAGEASWHGFAQAIFEQEKARNPNLKCQKINPIPASEYPLPAKRPFNSRLDCSKAQRTFGITMPDWKAGLTECFKAV